MKETTLKEIAKIRYYGLLKRIITVTILDPDHVFDNIMDVTMVVSAKAKWRIGFSFN